MKATYWIVTDEDTGEQLKSLDKDVAEVFYENRAARNHEVRVDQLNEDGTTSLVKIYYRYLGSTSHTKI